MIVIFTGLPGSGKSAKLARSVIDVLYRNRKWQKKTGVLRKVYTNLKLSSAVENEFKEFIVYWTDLRELTKLRDCDVVIDEVATYFDARLWETLSLEMRRWLAQHRKFGIEIYGTAQDFAQVDKAFRRLTSDLLYLRKIFGTPDISPTRPARKWVFVLSLVQSLDPTRYDEEKSKFQGNGFFSLRPMIITKSDVNIFDTRAEVMLSKALPLNHIDQVGELPNCTFHKTRHVCNINLSQYALFLFGPFVLL